MSNASGAIKISIRLFGKVTSFTLKKNIVAIWMIVCGVKAENHKSELINFAIECSTDWLSDNGKGFSDFITQKMLEDVLGKKDFKEYLSILGQIQ